MDNLSIEKPKTHSWPENHWHWPVELSHYHGVRRGGLIFTGGQADLDQHGDVVNPGELTKQTQNVLHHVEKILADFDASFRNLVKFVIYFTGDDSDEAQILDLIAGKLSGNTRPVVSSICLPELCYPGMRIELEAVAVDPVLHTHTNPEFKRSDSLPALHTAFSHAARCNDLIFTSDMSAVQANGDIHAPDNIIEQTRIMMNQLDDALGLFKATAKDVLKLNVFYLGDGTAQNWAEPAAIRAAFFQNPGPAATGMAVGHFAQPGLMTKISVTAAALPDQAKHQSATASEQDSKAAIRYSWPEGHWDWTSPLPYKHGNRFGEVIHLGGQVALDSNANVLHPDDMVQQTKIALNNIQTILADLGAAMDDIVKVTTFYKGSASAEALHENLQIRSKAFNKPGPATSGIPMPYLVYEGMVIEIEVIAVVEAD